MTTYLGKICSFGLPRVPFVNCRQFLHLVISLLVLRAGCGIWLYQFLIIAYLVTLVVLEHPMLHTKIQGHRHFGSGEEDVFLGFYHIWAWRPSWSCDQDHLSKFSFPNPIEAPYEIWLWLAQWFLRRRCLKSVDDGRRRRTTDDRGLPIL